MNAGPRTGLWRQVPCPRPNKSRAFGPGVTTTSRPTAWRDALVAKLGAQPILAKRPLAARKRVRRPVAPHAAARTRRRRKAGVSDRPSRRPVGRRGRGPRCWRGGGQTPSGGSPLLLSHRRHSGRQPWRLLDTAASGSHGESAASATKQKPTRPGHSKLSVLGSTQAIGASRVGLYLGTYVRRGSRPRSSFPRIPRLRPPPAYMLVG